MHQQLNITEDQLHAIRQSLVNHKRLWEVDDSYLEMPGRKFSKVHSALIEATVEQWDCTQFENAQLPRSLFEFVEKFVAMFGVTNSKFSTVDKVCRDTVWRVEFEDPYFFVVDAAISLDSNGELRSTYRHRVTGDIMDPTRIEVFHLNRDWDYPQWNMIKNCMEHPETKQFLNKNVLPPGFENRESAMYRLLDSIATKLWGSLAGLEHLVSTMLDSYEEEAIYESGSICDVYDRDELSSALGRDRIFWVVCTIGTLLWFKSPKAMPFLIAHHILYAELLDIDEVGRFVPVRGTGDEVIVDGVNVYTQSQFEKIENRTPDTCICCGIVSHCTKFINLTAIAHPVCSCGYKVDPFESGQEAYNEHHKISCQGYLRAHPPRSGYVCQRCIFAQVNNVQPDFMCGRTTCPAVSCKHHRGAAARLRALTQQRTKQLTCAAAR